MSDTKAAIKDTMAKVVENLVRLVEASDGSNWIKPWINLGLGKQFKSNGEPYQGTNQIFLSLIAASEGLTGPHIWAGYNTWLDMGYKVIPGQKSPYRPIYAFVVRTCEVHGKRTEDGKCCPAMISFMRVKVLRAVFHISQVAAIEGQVQTLPKLPELPVPSFEPSEEVRRLAENWKRAGMVFKDVDSDRAFYSPIQDFINLPPVEAFHSEVGYLSTLLHEATHWTGHETRLKRPNLNFFGSEKYALEELVAELGTAMISVELGFDNEPGQHAEYLASWLGALKADPTKLYDSAVEAEKASKLLIELGKEKVEDGELTLLSA